MAKKRKRGKEEEEEEGEKEKEEKRKKTDEADYAQLVEHPCRVGLTAYVDLSKRELRREFASMPENQCVHVSSSICLRY